MVHIICLKVGQLYSSKYVNCLHRGIERNVSKVDFDFTCFTDDFTGIDTEIACRSLPVKLEGWWNKLWFFSNSLGITDRIVYMDLDSVIVGPIDKILQFDGEFAILRDFYRARKNPKALQYGSGLMAWKGGWGFEIWSQFYKDVERNARGGDQDYLMKVIPPELGKTTYWQDYMASNEVISYKAHIRDVPEPKNILPPEAKFVAFHGVPRPHEISTIPFMVEHWR